MFLSNVIVLSLGREKENRKNLLFCNFSQNSSTCLGLEVTLREPVIIIIIRLISILINTIIIITIIIIIIFAIMINCPPQDWLLDG